MTTHTYTRYLLQLDSAEDQPGLNQILIAVSVVAKQISGLLSLGPLIVDTAADEADPTRSEVVEEVMRAFRRDLQAETAFIKQLGAVSVEGEPEPIQVSENGRYLLLVGRLQGMENLADNLMVGTTFSVLERNPGSGAATTEDFLQPGTRQVCAGLVLFGVRTILLLTTGDGVDGFTLDRNLGSFVLTNPGMGVPEGRNRYSIDGTQAPQWPPPIKRYVDECIQGTDGPREQEFVMRWNPSPLVGVFRVINSGGLYLRPDVGKETELVPLLHSAAPLAFLVEQAGGTASTGTRRIVSVQPESLLQRTGYYLGAADEVERVEQYFSDFEAGLDREDFYPLFGHRSLFTT